VPRRGFEGQRHQCRKAEGGKDVTPREWAAEFDTDLRMHIENTPRRAQKDRGEIGASDFDCTQRMAYILGRKPETDSTDYWAAYVGTAMDDRIKASRKAARPDLLFDLILPVRLQLEDGSEFTFNLAPDEADPTEPAVTDYKGLPLDTPLPTPTGWTTMGDVRVGDRLIGSDGRPCTVTAKSQVKQIGTKIVRFGDGNTQVCDTEHIWWTVSGPRFKESVLSIGEIEATLRYGTQPRHRVPLANPVDLPPVELPIDPYVLGVWLGNGTASAGRVTIGDQDEPEMRLLLDRSGAPLGARGQRKGDARAVTYSLGKRAVERGPSGTFCGNGSLTSTLRTEGLLGGKRVPPAYLRGSIVQRRALVQGLMDTDGSWSKVRNRAVFSTTSHELADAVVELLASLGERPSVDAREATGFGVGTWRFQIEWTPLTFVPFRLTRKASAVAVSWRQVMRSAFRTIVAVDEGPDVPTACVAVDSPNRTYLCGRLMIPTHNTADGLAKARKDRVHDARRRQRHLQYLAMMQNYGWPDTGTVRNVIVDRAGKDSRHFVEQETFSWDVVKEAADMLSSALYAAKHNEPTSQDRPRAFCERFCTQFTRCRGAEVEYDILNDPATIDLVAAYRTAQDEREEANELMSELRDLLPKVTGIAGKAQMRWTTANLKTGPSERLEVSWL
jgi:hypothetical protein